MTDLEHSSAERSAQIPLAFPKPTRRRPQPWGHFSSLVPGGSAMLQRAYTRIGCEGRPPRFRVEFYPYSTLSMTIRRREDLVIVRLSDLLRRAPLAVLESGAALILSRLYRRRGHKALFEAYLDYARSDRTRERITKMRSGRVRLRSAGPQGKHFDLHALFDELNLKYFGGELARPHIGWSTRGWRRQFEYVLYHEMLHVKHPTRRSGCTLLSHSPEFRAEEKRFAEFTRARKALDSLAR